MGLLFSATVMLGACGILPLGQPYVVCGELDDIGCNELIELGHDVLAAGRMDTPVAIAATGACPPNARCMAWVPGGNTAAVAVRWADGVVVWGTIPLAADWPDSPAGPVTIESGPPPDHLLTLLEP